MVRTLTWSQLIETSLHQKVHYQFRYQSLQNSIRKRLGLYCQKVFFIKKFREYNYDVVLKGVGYSALVGNVLLSWRIFVTKGMVWWPLVIAAPATYFYITPLLLQKHSKKLFDMCNVGEEFYLGRKRNEILRKCNQILDTEDFWNLFDHNNLFIIMPCFIKYQSNSLKSILIQ